MLTSYQILLQYIQCEMNISSRLFIKRFILRKNFEAKSFLEQTVEYTRCVQTLLNSKTHQLRSIFFCDPMRAVWGYCLERLLLFAQVRSKYLTVLSRYEFKRVRISQFFFSI